MKINLTSLFIVILGLIFWQLMAIKIALPHILPSPIQVLEKIWELKDILFLVHLPATLQIIVLGTLISVALGILLAVLMDLYPKVEKALYPLVITSQTIPTTVIAPLLVLWFGYSIWSKILVTILITFFPITIALFDGFKSSKLEMEELLFTFGANKKDIFLKLKLPCALPYFFSALKMAIPLSIIGAAISEWLGAQSGLGYFSKRMMTQLDGAGVFAPIIILALIALIGVGFISFWEKKILKWRKDL